jgi:4-amino-4-deoxy-L-arabinose transferase-like glycosyltransferase
MFHTARLMIGVSGAIAASASLLLFPHIGWESQLDRTHTVLLTCLACATLWCYFALPRHPAAKRYALFGLLVGLCLQSKYNFAIFIACLASASLLHAQHRHTLWNRNTWIAAAIALLYVLPHGLWLLDNFDVAAGDTLQEMSESSQESDFLGNVAAGMGSMLLGVLAFITPLWLIYGLICWRYRKQAAVDWHSPNARFFIYLYAAFFAWMMVLLLSGKVSQVKSRWMQPALFSLPLAFFVVLPALAQPAIFQRILQVAGVVAVGVLIALPLRVYLGPALGKYVRAHHPYPQLSAELARRFPEARILIAGDRLTAGNLYFQRPGLQVLLLDDVMKQPERLEGEMLLVGDSTQAGCLKRFRAAYPGSVAQQQGRLALCYRYGGTESMSFDYALVVARSL